MILILRPDQVQGEAGMQSQEVWARGGQLLNQVEQVRPWSSLWKFCKGSVLFGPFLLPPRKEGLLLLSIILNLKWEQFGSEVRPELVGKYEQNHFRIFHLFPNSTLIVNVHCSGAGHLKSSCPYTSHLFSIALLPE